MPRRPDAVVFDLLTALLDSWSLWDDVAGSQATGRAWREEYLRRMYATGGYRRYEDVLADATRDAGLDPALGVELLRRWDDVRPWPEAPEVLADLAGQYRLGVLTNCSQALGERAAATLGVALDVVATAEEAGHYKPHPSAYALPLQRLGLTPDRVVFVAGSAGDVPGATDAGMAVVWHNRAGMAPKPDAPEVPVIDDLRALPDLLVGD